MGGLTLLDGAVLAIRQTDLKLMLAYTTVSSLGLLVTPNASAQAPATVTLTRLDCGTNAAPSDVARFSDTYAYNGLRVQLAISCYLIRHGDDYMVWDTGNPAGTAANAPTIP